MVLVAVRDLLFGSKIDAAAKRLGVEVVFAPRNMPLSAFAQERRPQMILADLGEPGFMAELRAILGHAPATRVVGFLGHLRTDLMDEARSLGVEEVLTRGQLAASLDDVLLRAAAAAGAADPR
ncbi:MAG TPA: hypothetical protein VF904_03665 [Anaeromyxobacteraceae bacterium]